MFRSDKKYYVVIRAVAFVMVFIAMFAYLEAIIHDYTEYHAGWRYVYYDEIDVLIVGSSQVHYSIDAQSITDETDKSVVDLSSGAQSVKQSYYHLLEVFKYQQPDLLMLEMYGIIEDTLTWMEGNGTTGLILNGIDDMKMSPQKLYSSFSLLGFQGYGIFHIMRESGKTERLIAAIKDIKDRTLNLFNRVPTKLTAKRGYLRAPPGEMATAEEYARRLDVEIDPDFVIIEENLKYMDKIIELCEKNDVPIEFVKTPLLKRKNILSGMAFLDNYFDEKGYNINVYNLMDEQYDINLIQKDYADLNHLSYEGSIVVTEWFVEHIKDYYESQ